MTREQVDLHRQYAIDHAADHDYDCPGDDTCDCCYKSRNEAVSLACEALRAAIDDIYATKDAYAQLFDPWQPIATIPQDGTRVLIGPAVWVPERVVTAYRSGPLWWVESADVRGSMRAFTPPEEDDTYWPFRYWMPIPELPK